MPHDIDTQDASLDGDGDGDSTFSGAPHTSETKPSDESTLDRLPMGAADAADATGRGLATRSRLRSQPSPMTIALLTLTVALLFTLAFAASYLGALHKPTPHQVAVELVAPAAVAQRTASSLNRLPGDPLKVTVAGDLAAALHQVNDRRSYAVYDVSDQRLYVASAANRLTAQTLTTLFSALVASGSTSGPATGAQPGSRATTATSAALSVVDLKPLPAQDPVGTSLFYVVLAWVFGGYMASTLLGLAKTSRSRSRRGAMERLGVLAGFSVVTSVVTTVVLRGAFGVFGGHVLVLCLIGTLVIFATAAATAGLQALGGPAGTAIVILLFVIFGNSSSGGAYARPLLPQPWRLLGGLLPPGAGVDLTRDAVYFGGAGGAVAIVVLCAWMLAGVVAAVAVGGRVSATSQPEAEVAAAGIGV